MDGVRPGTATSPIGDWLTPQNTAIPVLPTFAGRVIEMTSDPNVSLVQLANVIAKDQVLASRLLGLANSAYCAPMQEITTISEAVIRIGTGPVRNLVFTVCFSSKMYDPSIYGEQGRTLIEHGIGTAYMARIVADQAGESEDEAFLSGLLHDIGKLLILKLAFDYKRRTGTSIPADEVATAIDQHHASFGGITLRRWGLPTSLDEPIRCHHDYRAATHTPRKAMVVYLADRLSHRYGFGCDPDAYNLIGDAVCREFGIDTAWLTEVDGRAQGLFDVARAFLAGAPSRA
ncbi:MAG TPA: HDOD domain-containing protein [Vicinamibacterales bacterium]|jgi:HD-like signal output (HDOD) protein